jgi:hypothetical protein
MWTPNGWSYPPARSRVAPYEAVMEEAYGNVYPPPPLPRHLDERDARWRGDELGRPLK